MTEAVILDVVIVAVLVLFMYQGRKRGLFRTLADLAVVAVALVLAYQIAGFAAGVIVENYIRPAAHEAIVSQVDETIRSHGGNVPTELDLAWVLEAIPEGFLRDKAMEALENLDLSPVQQAGQAAREKLLQEGYRMVDKALDTVVYGVLQGVICAVIFLLLLIVLKMVVKTLDLTTKLPLIHQFNELGGLLIGAGKGLVLVCLAVWVLSRTGVLSPQTLEGSYLVALAAKITGAAG